MTKNRQVESKKLSCKDRLRNFGNAFKNNNHEDEQHICVERMKRWNIKNEISEKFDVRIANKILEIENLLFHKFWFRNRSTYINKIGQLMIFGKEYQKDILQLDGQKLLTYDIQDVVERIKRDILDEKRDQEDDSFEKENIYGKDQSDALIKCKKCKSSNISIEGVQTRSGDEGLTMKYKCYDCKKQWK